MGRHARHPDLTPLGMEHGTCLALGQGALALKEGWKPRKGCFCPSTRGGGGSSACLSVHPKNDQNLAKNVWQKRLREKVCSKCETSQSQKMSKQKLKNLQKIKHTKTTKLVEKMRKTKLFHI